MFCKVMILFTVDRNVGHPCTGVVSVSASSLYRYISTVHVSVSGSSLYHNICTGVVSVSVSPDTETTIVEIYR
jgi:hypothetical protein